MKTPKIPNESWSGWWVVGILMENLDADESRFWNNLMLFSGKKWQDVYQKALEYAKRDEEGGSQKFIGITELLPIYDDLEDGAEIMYSRINDESCLQGVLTFEKISSLYEC